MKKLTILGLSYSQTQSGAYALVLAEENGKRRIPIIIGGAEAQSIAIQLEGLHPPRPLTHDLFLAFANAFEIQIKRVNIYKLEEGIFHSEIICESADGRNVKLDARTSDAVALALRFQCSIYTTDEILAKAGIVLDNEEATKDEENEDILNQDPFARYNVSELEEQMNQAIEEENYELASEIRDEINRRNENEDQEDEEIDNL